MNAYAVPDACPLNILWERVRNLFLDQAIDFGNPEEEPWNEQMRRMFAAEAALHKALLSEQSRVFFANSSGSHILHAPHLFRSDQLNRYATFVTGSYISFEQPGPNRDYLDQKLWVKDADAEVMMRAIEVELRGKSSGTALSSVRSTAAAEKECEQWLLARFAEQEPATSKAKLKPLALEHFAGRLSGAGFNRVWDRIAPPERRTSGAKKRGNRLAN